MIRAMRADDKTIVMDIIRETGFFTADEVQVAEELIDIYLNDPKQKDYRVVVVEDPSGRTVGYLTWGPTPMTDGTYDIYWMAVAPSTQGRGYGKLLLGTIEAEIGSAGGRLIVIETSSQPKYHPTREFYLRLGYKEVARIPDFYRVGDDRIIYIKKPR